MPNIADNLSNLEWWRKWPLFISFFTSFILKNKVAPNIFDQKSILSFAPHLLYSSFYFQFLFTIDFVFFPLIPATFRKDCYCVFDSWFGKKLSYIYFRRWRSVLHPDVFTDFVKWDLWLMTRKIRWKSNVFSTIKITNRKNDLSFLINHRRTSCSVYKVTRWFNISEFFNFPYARRGNVEIFRAYHRLCSRAWRRYWATLFGVQRTLIMGNKI